MKLITPLTHQASDIIHKFKCAFKCNEVHPTTGSVIRQTITNDTIYICFKHSLQNPPTFLPKHLSQSYTTLKITCGVVLSPIIVLYVMWIAIDRWKQMIHIWFVTPQGRIKCNSACLRNHYHISLWNEIEWIALDLSQGYDGRFIAVSHDIWVMSCKFFPTGLLEVVWLEWLECFLNEK